MDFVNETPWQARRFYGGLDDRTNIGWVVVRASFRWEGERLVSSDAQWPIVRQQLRTDHGVFPPDDYPLRRGCDLVVVGSARSRVPVESLVASVEVGDFQSRIVVYGERRWQKGRGGLVPSAPEPFEEMPLDWSRAFGGGPEVEGVGGIHPLNPRGRGLYLSEEAASGQLLPNLEDPAEPIKSPRDTPMPVSWYPVGDGASWQIAAWAIARAKAGEQPTSSEFGATAQRAFPSASIPRHIMPRAAPGQRVAVRLGDDRASFTIPPMGFAVAASVGAERIERPAQLTGVWIFMPTRLAVFTWLARFKYDLRPLERRDVRLREVPA